MAQMNDQISAIAAMTEHMENQFSNTRLVSLYAIEKILQCVSALAVALLSRMRNGNFA